eukprot:GHVU01140754.1.p1 GENE.GHVU01140754.1~~GHVU01140754.1.p1  ORF type:complete len:315 (-),score=70.43 GHVU01140754.1:402-1346(-)
MGVSSGCLPKKSSFLSKYELIEKIGCGADSQVWTCRNRKTGVVYAVKMTPKLKSDDAFKFESYVLEFVSAYPSCEYVLQYEASLTEKHFNCIVLEHCGGGELFATLAKKDVAYTDRCVAKWVRQLLLAMDFLHSLGIVHRNLLPENIMFRDESMESIKLVDLSRCHLLAPNSLVEDLSGDPRFWAPEMLLGNYGRKVDIWAVGVIAYLMLFGRLPFTGPEEGSLFDAILEEEACFLYNDDDNDNNGGDGGGTMDDSGAPPSLAVDFVRGLLSKNCIERPTATVALKHQFLCSSSSNAATRRRFRCGRSQPSRAT